MQSLCFGKCQKTHLWPDLRKRSLTHILWEFLILTIFKLSYSHSYLWQRYNPWYNTSNNLQLMPPNARSLKTPSIPKIHTCELHPGTPWWCSTKTSFPRHCCSNASSVKHHVWFRLHIALQKYASLKYAHFEKRVKVPFHRSGHIWLHDHQKTGTSIHVQYNECVGIVRMFWDMAWHICYLTRNLSVDWLLSRAQKNEIHSS